MRERKAEAEQRSAPQRRFAISKIWHDAHHRAELRKLCPEGWAMRRRARGYRFGRRDYHQSFPLELCVYFTMYCEPKIAHRYRDPSWYSIQQCEFVGFTEKGDKGKPIIRLLNPILEAAA